MIGLGEMHANSIILVASFDIVTMALEPLGQFPLGLTYVLFATFVAADTVDQVGTSAGNVYHAWVCRPLSHFCL